MTDFIRSWREQGGKDPKAFVPLLFENGEAFQFDWSEEGLLVGGLFYKVQVAHMKLCASRAFWLVAYPSQTHEMLFDAHTRSFAALGGVARRGIYNNMKTAVDQVKQGKARVVNARFKAMCSHYLFDADFCNVASGWEKGIVEKNVQDSRRRIWIEASQQGIIGTVAVARSAPDGYTLLSNTLPFVANPAPSRAENPPSTSHHSARRDSAVDRASSSEFR